MNQESQRSNGVAHKAPRIKPSLGPRRQSHSPERSKSVQPHHDMANIPESGPKMVTLLKVSPRNASVASRRGEPNHRAAVQEKRSQYLEYAAQVEARRRELLQPVPRKQERQPRSKNFSNNNQSKTVDKSGKTQSQPQLAHRQLVDIQHGRAKTQPPSKPQRRFTQSPPRQVIREPKNVSNGAGASVAQNRQQLERMRDAMAKQQAKHREEHLHPRPNSSNQVPPRSSSRSPTRRLAQSKTTETPVKQFKIKVDVHTSVSSTSPSQSLPTSSSKEDESVLSWIDKMEVPGEDKVSRSYPPPGRSQSAGPGTRESTSKAQLQQDLKNFDQLGRIPRQRVHSPDAAYRSTTNLPVSRDRQSRLDEFAKAHKITNDLLLHKAPSKSRIPVKKGLVDNLRGENHQRQNFSVERLSPVDPEPPPRRRSSRQRTPESTSNTQMPSRGTDPQTNQRKESNDPSRIKKSSQHQEKRRSKTDEQPFVERARKTVSSKHQEITANIKTHNQSPQTPESPVVSGEKAVDVTPKRPKMLSPHDQELRRRLSEILMERKNSGGSSNGLRKSSKTKERKTSQEDSPDVIDRMLDSTTEQDFKGELDRNLARQKNKLERSLEDSHASEEKKSKDPSAPQRSKRLSKRNEHVGKSTDSGLGASYESRSNQVVVTDGEILHPAMAQEITAIKAQREEMHSAKKRQADESNVDKSASQDNDFVVSEWNDDLDNVQPTIAEVNHSQISGAVSRNAQVEIKHSAISGSTVSAQAKGASLHDTTLVTSLQDTTLVTSLQDITLATSLHEITTTKIPQNTTLATSLEDITPTTSPQNTTPTTSPSDMNESRRKKSLRRWSISSDGGRPKVDKRPVSYGGYEQEEIAKSSILSSMKVGISVPFLGDNDEVNRLGDVDSSLDDSNGLLNVQDLEDEIEKSSSAATSSVQSTPRRSPSWGDSPPPPTHSILDSEEATTNSVQTSPRRTTPPKERLLHSPISTLSGIERSHQSSRHALPIKVLPTSPTSSLPPTFSEDHDMSVMTRPLTPQQSKSPSDSNQSKTRYLKIAGMQLLPQKLQFRSSKEKTKGVSPTNPDPLDEPDGAKQGHYKKSEYRGRERSRKDSNISPGPKMKKRSASADGLFSFHRERSPSPSGLRGFGSPGRQGRLKDRRGKQKMTTSSGNQALRMPRQPRPQRMHTILDSLKKGLKDTIEVSKEKLDVMKQHQHDPSTTPSRQGFHYNLDKQIKVAERYIRKLQFHLAKVEEVHDQYDKELKVREGAVNVVKAYADTGLPHSKEPSNEAKAGVRDCTQSLCQMEAELEANLGAFIVRIEGIAGFARVCRGDVFEVVFKYGLQKWKSKCKVEKDLSQSWDVDEIVMYPMLADFLTIKVTEVRGIARSNMVIGNLEFDTSDFYTADPQTLTIDVNENGTIKLNLVVTWSPFHVNEEMFKSPKNSYSRRERAFTESIISPSRSFTESMNESTNTPKKTLPKPYDLNTSPTLTLDEAMHNVNRLLEILKGQYTELGGLEKQVRHLNDLIQQIRERKKRDSSMSLLVKNALDSFDFLNEVGEDTEDVCLTVDSGSCSMDENRSSFASDDFCKSQSSDRLSDCASLEEPVPTRWDSPSPSTYSFSTTPTTLPMTRANRGSRIINMSEKRESRLIEMNEQRERRLVDSPSDVYGRCWDDGSTDGMPKMTTGSDSIDSVLVQHLMYIEYLLSHLGAFGPLKLKETIALQKLKKQAVVIEQLVILAVSTSPITRADDVFPELKLNPVLLDFWQHCAEKEALYVNAESFLLQLDVKFGAKLRTTHPDIADDVFQSLCTRVIERPVDLYNQTTTITLFQYISFFATDDRRNPEKFITDLTKEFELTASLEPSNPDLLKVIKKLPRGSLLSIGNLRALGLLLLEDRSTLQMGVRMYLDSIGGDERLRKKAVNVYLECLEERDLSLRQAGCAAIAALKATEALDQLLYLLKCDMDDVKSTAKEALMAFGEEGRQAYEQISTTSYGTYNHNYSEIEVPVMTTEL
ncbi:serine/arginine repetitive matrix protein 2-like [Asterias rubens]|uniref:serine/arginine repetitive matrix protein 2-like n=1 Tax=Asterias rubens TaxID=7604 RepID=UPI0014558CCA|nr:serine/arginine repetitive matrix protein 2-like [Asterias rubens]